MTHPVYGVGDLSESIRKIETDLLDQGIKLFPPTRSGERAQSLWLKIKPRLLRGASADITISALNLDWHREELRRAKSILIDMELIKPRADGCYVLGRLGPYSKIDELLRNEFFFLKLAEAAMLALSALAPKSKTHEGSRPSSASHYLGAE